MTHTQNKKDTTGGDAATSSSTSGVRPTPNTQKETVMSQSNPTLPEIQIIGDGTPSASHGTAEVWSENGTINITLPDRFGTPGPMLNFTFDDAASIAAELNRVLDEEATR